MLGVLGVHSVCQMRPSRTWEILHVLVSIQKPISAPIGDPSVERLS